MSNAIPSGEIPEIIDWRNIPDQVIDILGQEIVLISLTPPLTRSELEILDQETRKVSALLYREMEKEQWLQSYVAAAALSMRFIVEVAKFEHTDDHRPITIRFGMDRNNAVPKYPAIAFEPYIILTGSSDNYTFSEYQGDRMHKWSRPFGNIYAISQIYRSNQYNYTRLDHINMCQIADLIEDITEQARTSLEGEYHLESPMRVAFKQRKGKVITLESDCAVSRDKIKRSYGPWNLDGGFLGL